jgi:peptide deformylase
VALTHPDYCNSTDYQAYINPVIKTKRGEVSEIEEQCLAIPFITFIVPRYE